MPTSGFLSKAKRLVRCVLAAAALTAFLMPHLSAAEPCTNRNLIGSFGFYGTGFVVQSPVTNVTGPFARLGRFESDGNGNLTFTSTASFNGQLVGQDFTGSYAMNPDCTFTTVVHLPDPINLSVNFVGVLSDDGNEIRDLFVNPPGVVIYGPGRKQHLTQCTDRNLVGTFQLEFSGTIVPSFVNTRVPFAGLAKITADGAGRIAGKLSGNYGGFPVVEEEITGTYAVQPTCIFQLTYYTAGESRGPNDGVTLKGVLTDGGKAAFVMILQPSSATVIGSLKLVQSNQGVPTTTESRRKIY